MYKKKRSNKGSTQKICNQIYSLYLKYPANDFTMNIGSNKTLEVLRDRSILRIKDNEILRIQVSNGRFSTITISDGNVYDFNGCPAATTREILNGLFDLFEQLGVLPRLKLFFNEDHGLETYVGYQKERTLFGRNWANSLHYECYSKNIKPAWTESNTKPSIEIPSWLQSQDPRPIRTKAVGSQRNQAKFVKSLLNDGRQKKCILCEAPSDVIEAAHILPHSERGKDHGGNGIFLCRNHHHLFDRNIIVISPRDYAILCLEGRDSEMLGITKNIANHGIQGPSRQAFALRWQEICSKSTNSYVKIRDPDRVT